MEPGGTDELHYTAERTWTGRRRTRMAGRRGPSPTRPFLSNEDTDFPGSVEDVDVDKAELYGHTALLDGALGELFIFLHRWAP